MKTKIIPFDLETAKKIQAGEIEGKIIKVVNKCPVRIICWDRKSDSSIVALYEDRSEQECVIAFDNKGEFEGNVVVYLEVPDNEPQFKPFDRVLVRDDDNDIWYINFFSHSLRDNNGYNYICCAGKCRQCIPYEGNEYLVGTTDKPKEE